jgi:ABC-type branched-subunit amino acid transport system substrate-binding protein
LFFSGAGLARLSNCPPPDKSGLKNKKKGGRSRFSPIFCGWPLVLAAMLMAACGCPWRTWAAAQATNVVIGLLLPPEEAEAASLRAGVLLAVEHANRAPAPKVSLVVRGRVGQWGADAVEAARMVLDDGAQGLIAPPNGAATHLALQVAGRTAVPVISLCADSSVSRTGVPWMVRIAPSTIEEARALSAGLNAGAPGPQRWVSLVPDGRAGREVSRDLNRACKLKNIHEVSSTLTRVESVVGQVLKEQPDGLLIWLDPVPAGRLARNLRDAGFAGKLAGPSRCNSPAFFASSAEASEGFVVPAIVLDADGEARLLSFQTAFRQHYGIEADLTAAEGYDAATLLAHILKKNDPQSLPRAFPLAFSLPGASGGLSFDAEGNRKLALRLLVARHGRFGAVTK